MKGTVIDLKNATQHVTTLIQRYPALISCQPDIIAAFEMLVDSYKNQCKLLVCGNGGSAADSDHIVGELMKGFMKKREIPALTREKLSSLYGDEGLYLAENLQGALPAISLTQQGALATAFSNDVNPSMVFAQQVYGYGQSGDVLIGLSTSGNSDNVLNAIKIAKLIGLKTIGLTGESGGMMRELCDITICVPSNVTPEIQEYHLPIYHTLCIMLEEVFFGS